MSTAEAADSGIKQAAYTAYSIAGISGLVALLAWFIFRLTSPWALIVLLLIDAVLFAAIGLFISRRSRMAAVLGLVLYLPAIESIVARAGGSIAAFLPVALMLAMFFINGVRGSFSRARLER